MKTIIGCGLSLLITVGFMGCNSTEGNTNLRNMNTNAGYVVPSANSSSPQRTSSPMMNSNMGNKPKSGMNANSNMNSKTNNNGKPK